MKNRSFGAIGVSTIVRFSIKRLWSIFLFDCLLLDGDKSPLQRSEELFPFSLLSVKVVLCSSVWVDRSLHFLPTVSKISMLFSINHFMSTTLRNVPLYEMFFKYLMLLKFADCLIP